MPLQHFRAAPFDPHSDAELQMNAPLVADWLVAFLRDECVRRRKVERAVVGLSGGVDSAVTAALCSRAFGPENTLAVRLPYKVSSSASLEHAQLVVELYGVRSETIDISAMVDGYVAAHVKDNPTRVGNVCARCRMTVLYDISARERALPIGTSNKTERLFGYYTWHGDDAPAINPLGDLFKTQVWALAQELGVPEVIVEKPPTADLLQGQTDEGDWGISIREADRILVHLVRGVPAAALKERGFEPAKVDRVFQMVAKTHWKRHLPTTAMLTDTSINDYYLRPVDL